jgi:hypothetical protein
MSSHRINPLPVLMTLIILASLACQIPETGISTPTNVPATLLALPTGIPTTRTMPLAILSSPTPHPTAPPAVAAQRIAIHSIYGLAEFYDRTTSANFIPRGVSYALLVPVLDHYEDHLLAVGIYDHNRTQADFATLSSLGYNTIRIIFDGCISGDGCVGMVDGQGLNPDYLDNLTDLLRLAQANHLLVLLASQGVSELGGYASLANQGANGSFGQGRNAQLLTKAGILASRKYWTDLIEGLALRQAPFDTILGWELLGEQYFEADQPPFSLQNGRVTLANSKSYDLSLQAQRQALAVDGLSLYINQVKQAIVTYDPTALVTMGFLAPNSPNAWREGDNRYVETSALLESSSLDFFDLHASPGAGLSLAQAGQNFGLGGHVTKPVIMGEVGASTWSYPQVSQAAIAVQDWIAASCVQGFAGWLYSSYYPYPAGLADATWGFVDEHGSLLNAFAPVNQPDACTVTVLPGRDLALGKPVQVSASLPDQTPEMAVDGDTNTQWSAGEFPTQWIEIDLGAGYSIGEIRLTIGQWPEGNTVHQLWVGASLDSLQKVAEFTDYTYDYDVLSFTPPSPLQNVRFVRVVTTDSLSWVSWREIEVLAPFPATPTATPEVTLTPMP